jgi:D-sedoheptulose 7-phosphate isomerase
MLLELIEKNFYEAQKSIADFISDKSNFVAIENAALKMFEALESGNKIISCGNGGSMSDAMHFAEELSGFFRKKRKSFAAISISDPSYISCVANDLGYDYIFSRFVEGHGKTGDVLLAISTSGNSENVVLAAKEAKTKNMIVVALTGKNGGKLAEICDIEIRAPFSEFSDRVQEIHIKIIHTLINCIEEQLNNKI